MKGCQTGTEILVLSADSGLVFHILMALLTKRGKKERSTLLILHLSSSCAHLAAGFHFVATAVRFRLPLMSYLRNLSVVIKTLSTWFGSLPLHNFCP